MAYSRPPAKISTDAFDLTAYNAIRNSFIASAPDVFTTKGDLFVATGADAGARFGVGADNSTLVADSSQSTGLAWQIQPAVVLRNTTDTDPTTSTWTTLSWDTENVDTDGSHSTSSNTDRITVPSGGAGLWRIGANIIFNTNGLTGESGHYGVRIMHQGATVVGRVFDEAEMNGNDLAMYIEMPTSPAVAEYYTVQIYTTRDIDIDTDSRFWGYWVRR